MLNRLLQCFAPILVLISPIMLLWSLLIEWDRRRRIRRIIRPMFDRLEDDQTTQADREKILNALGDMMKDD